MLLQAANIEPGASSPLASRAFLSYQFSEGKFFIQSRKTTSDTSAELVDVDFYWAWVDLRIRSQCPAGRACEAFRWFA